jgi:homoserine kinase
VEEAAQTRWQPLMLAVDFKGATVSRVSEGADTPAA